MRDSWRLKIKELKKARASAVTKDFCCKQSAASFVMKRMAFGGRLSVAATRFAHFLSS